MTSIVAEGWAAALAARFPDGALMVPSWDSPSRVVRLTVDGADGLSPVLVLHGDPYRVWEYTVDVVEEVRGVLVVHPRDGASFVLRTPPAPPVSLKPGASREEPVGV